MLTKHYSVQYQQVGKNLSGIVNVGGWYNDISQKKIIYTGEVMHSM